jgi:hypothetical protein
MTVLQIRPRRWGWKVFEPPGVEPVFGTKDPAIGYATRACFRSGEIRVLDSTGNVERTIPFNEAARQINDLLEREVMLILECGKQPD